MASTSQPSSAKSNPIHRLFTVARDRFFVFLWRIISRIWLVLPVFIRKPVKRIKSLWEGRLIRYHQALLAALIEQYSPAVPVIVFAPCLDWNVQLFQRPQQLALALARRGALVFYPQPKPNFKQPPFQNLAERLLLCNVVIEAFDIIDSPVVYVLTWNSGYLKKFKSVRVLYDYVDNIDVFYGDHEQIASGHEQLVSEAEIIAVTALQLQGELQARRPDAFLCPNGVDYDYFAAARSQGADPPPEDMKPVLARGKPVIGYYGALARWFDYDLVYRLVDLRKEYSFVFIGPDYDGSLLSQRMLQRPNVYWLGVKSYANLPSYLRYFDVATIPFVVNEITHATSPLKLFEYMAGGKPVVVTPMHESMRYPGVLVGGSAEEFALRLDEALLLRSDPGYLHRIDEVARSNTWDSRADQILAALREKNRRL
jgi:hypothetical protein